MEISNHLPLSSKAQLASEKLPVAVVCACAHCTSSSSSSRKVNFCPLHTHCVVRLAFDSSLCDLVRSFWVPFTAFRPTSSPRDKRPLGSGSIHIYHSEAMPDFSVVSVENATTVCASLSKARGCRPFASTGFQAAGRRQNVCVQVVKFCDVVTVFPQITPQRDIGINLRLRRPLRATSGNA